MWPREIQWAPEAIAHIRSRGDRYPDADGIEPDWTQEVMEDDDLLALEPDPKSRMGASRFIGHSPSAERVIVVIAYRDLDGDLHGINAWPATGGDLKLYCKETMMAKTIDPGLAEKLREESEETKDKPYPAGTTGQQLNRQKVTRFG